MPAWRSSASDQACTRACCCVGASGKAQRHDHEAVEQMNHQAHNAPAGDKASHGEWGKVSELAGAWLHISYPIR